MTTGEHETLVPCALRTRMRSVLPLLALCCCLALAGCSFAFAGAGGPRTPAETLTPVPIDEPTPTRGPATRYPRTETRTPAETPFALPNGYGESGVTDPRVAARVHRAAVENASNYRLVARRVVDEPDGPRREREITRAVAGAERRVAVLDNGSLSLAVYDTGDTVYAQRYDIEPDSDRFGLRSRYVTVEGPTVDRQASDVLGVLRYQRGFAGVIIGNPDWGAVGVADWGGHPVLEYEATRPAEPLSADAGMTQYEARLLVEPSGLVRFAGVRGVLESEEGITELLYTTRYSELGTTTVDPPVWLSEVAHANATVRDGYVVVENTGDRDIPLARAEVDTTDGGYGTTLNGTLPPGDRLYVSAHPEVDSYRFSRSPPERGSYDPLNRTVTVTLGDESVSVVLGVEVES